MTIVIVISFLVYNGFREWLSYIHIKDLEAKLMARDVQEYAVIKGIDKPAKEIKEDVEDELVDPFDVDPADALKGIVK